MNVSDSDSAALLSEAQRGPDEVDLRLDLGGLCLENPVMPASGCFGPELASLVPTEKLGAVVTKTVFARRRSGNPAPRLGETIGGMVNSVGIPSPGSEAFLSDVLPRYSELGPPVIVSIGGLAIADYRVVASELADGHFAAFEVNVSCPNLEAGGLEVGSQPRQVERVVREVVETSSKPVIVKLTPNVTSISDIATAAENGGASALTVANTFVGYQLVARTGAPALGNGIGGVSGPGIKAMTLAKVAATARAVSIPIIGCGGVCTAADVLEYAAAGASAVQVGTATFTRPEAMIDILSDLPDLLREAGVSAFRALGSKPTGSR